MLAATMRPVLAIGLALVALAGCETIDLDRRDRDRDDDRDISFRCNDDRRFEAEFYDRGDRVRVEAGNRTYNLRLRDRSRDRREYEGEDGDVRLTIDDGEARLRIKDERDYSDCRRR